MLVRPETFGTYYIGVLVRGEGLFQTVKMWSEQTLSYLNLSRNCWWEVSSLRELIFVNDPFFFNFSFCFHKSLWLCVEFIIFLSYF